ncbi:splicing factor 3B subunit 1-like [Dorcoceras hygrometricum]|uniref:Splicing factor 3B subunit 1-like n=1 Tax=Dorcoceras hygrometricum TaxID=472368 RepID=A0A2Z7DF74_9LAMI|nr:splicing factor 3B subunit 1-like [Dorcoceras hygrometricum]
MFTGHIRSALVEFFHNTSVRDGMVVSTVQGKPVAISEELFARTFELPLEGLTDLHEVTKDLVFEARNAFSYDGKLRSTSCKNREMLFEFRLLNDILAKTVTVKAGSFDVVTHERFLMMSAIHGGVTVNRGRLLFNIFKDMVTPATRLLIKLNETAQMETDMEEPSVIRSDDIAVAATTRSIAVNNEVDNLDGAQNEISRKMASFTAPKQFLKEPLRSGENDEMPGSKQPSKIIEPTAAEKEMDIVPVATEDLSLAKSVAKMTGSEEAESLSKAMELTENHLRMMKSRCPSRIF